MDPSTAQPEVSAPVRQQDDIQYGLYAEHWTGQGYLASKYSGLRVLLLGERSLGVPPSAEGGPRTEVQPGTMSRTSRRFWRNLVSMIQGEGVAIDSEAFWRDIAYTTCLRAALPPGKRSPSATMWEEGRRAFSALMGEFAPGCVFALGYRLYDHLADLGTPGPAPESFSYDYGDGVAIVAKVKNPLAPGFAWQKEAIKIRRAITLTKLVNMA